MRYSLGASHRNIKINNSNIPVLCTLYNYYLNMLQISTVRCTLKYLFILPTLKRHIAYPNPPQVCRTNKTSEKRWLLQKQQMQSTSI